MLKYFIFSIIILLSIQNIYSYECANNGVYEPTYHKCYHYSSAALDFLSAEQHCQTLNGHLVSIRDEQENKIIASIVFKMFPVPGNMQEYWIGATNANNSLSAWTWTDYSVFGFSGWKTDEPNLMYHCALQDKRYSTWRTYPCNYPEPFMCETLPLPPTTIKTTPSTACPTVPTSYTTCDLGWTFFQNSCYRVFHRENWGVAEITCNQLNAHLTSIHSSDENIFVNELSAAGLDYLQENQHVWIGLRRINQDWVWADGSRLTYSQWDPQANFTSNSNNCVQTIADNVSTGSYRKWKNVYCLDQMRAFVCKKPAYHL